jgi:HAD superfamily hydrolase (TIGR01509 family)
MYELCLWTLSKQWFVDALNQHLGSNFSLDEVSDMWTKHYEITNEIQSCIEDLRNRWCMIWAVTNNNAIRIDALQQKFDFMKDFDVFISSHLCWYLKPRSEIFERLIEHSNCNAEEIIYADDREDRLDGARDLGIHCYVYDSLEWYKEFMREKGVEI